MLWIHGHKADYANTVMTLFQIEHVRELSISAAPHHQIAWFALRPTAKVQRKRKDDAVGAFHEWLA